MLDLACSTIDPTELLKHIPKPDVHTRRIVKFLQDHCLVAEDETELNKLLYLEYVRWSVENQLIPLGKKIFGNYLSRLGFPTATLSKGYYRIGLCLKQFTLPDGLASVNGIDLTEYTRRLIHKKLSAPKESVCKS